MCTTQVIKIPNIGDDCWNKIWSYKQDLEKIDKYNKMKKEQDDLLKHVAEYMDLFELGKKRYQFIHYFIRCNFHNNCFIKSIRKSFSSEMFEIEIYFLHNPNDISKEDFKEYWFKRWLNQLNWELNGWLDYKNIDITKINACSFTDKGKSCDKLIKISDRVCHNTDVDFRRIYDIGKIVIPDYKDSEEMFYVSISNKYIKKKLCPEEIKQRFT